jgi:O-antigen/teichoic acid export membrane protein
LDGLGIYSAGWQLILAVTIFQAQVDRVWRMLFSSDIVRSDALSLQKHIKEYLLFATLPVIALSCAVLIFAEEIVRAFYGSQYQSLTALIPVIASYFVVVNMDGLTRMCWIALGKFKEYTSVHLLVGLGLLAWLALQPFDYGMLGFAASVAVAHGLAVAILMMRFYRTHVKAMLLTT